MFEFLKKPLENGTISARSDNEREINIESTDTPHGEDVGQIAVDILETQE